MKLVEAATGTGRVARDFRFCDQFNDAALDATSDVAEGFVRYYPREFARFLDHALASLEEVWVRVEAGYRKEYFSQAATSELLRQTARAQGAVRGLRAYLWTVNRADLPPKPHRERPELPKRRAKDAKRRERRDEPS